MGLVPEAVGGSGQAAAPQLPPTFYGLRAPGCQAALPCWPQLQLLSPEGGAVQGGPAPPVPSAGLPSLPLPESEFHLTLITSGSGSGFCTLPRGAWQVWPPRTDGQRGTVSAAGPPRCHVCLPSFSSAHPTRALAAANREVFIGFSSKPNTAERTSWPEVQPLGSGGQSSDGTPALAAALAWQLSPGDPEPLAPGLPRGASPSRW